MIMGTAMMDTGMMNTGRTTTGVTATGRTIPMDTIASTLSGGIRGGGISSGGGAIGAITSRGTFSIADSTSSGMMMAVGGFGQDMVAGCAIDYRTLIMKYG